MEWLDAAAQTALQTWQNVTETAWNAVPPELIEHLDLTKQAVHSSVDAAKLWWRVFYPLFAFIAFCAKSFIDFINPWWPVIWNGIKAAANYAADKFMTYAWPYIVQKSEEVYQKLLDQDPWTVFLVAVALVAILCIYWSIRWFLRQDYLKRAKNRIVSTYTRTSNAVHSAFLGLKRFRPFLHVAFLGHAVFYVRQQPPVGGGGGPHPVAFWICAVVLPSVLSFRELHVARTQANYDYSGVRHWLKYWTVVGFGAVVLELPLMETIIGYIGFIVATRVHVVVWLWFWYTDGAEIVYNLIAPIIYGLVLQWIPRPRAQIDQLIHFACRMMAPIVPDAFRGIATRLGNSLDLILELWPVLPCVPVLLMAGFFNMWAALYAGLVFPIYCCVLLMTGPRPDQTQQNTQPPPHVIPIQPEVRWLTYWTVFAPYKMVHYLLGYWLSGVVGWYNTHNLIVLWLLFKLANEIVDAIEDMCYSTAQPNHAVQQQPNSQLGATAQPVATQQPITSPQATTQPQQPHITANETDEISGVQRRASRNTVIGGGGQRSMRSEMRQRSAHGTLQLGVKAPGPPPGESSQDAGGASGSHWHRD